MSLSGRKGGKTGREKQYLFPLNVSKGSLETGLKSPHAQIFVGCLASHTFSEKRYFDRNSLIEKHIDTCIHMYFYDLFWNLFFLGSWNDSGAALESNMEGVGMLML